MHPSEHIFSHPPHIPGRAESCSYWNSMNIPFDIVTHTLALKGLVSDQKSANRCDVDPGVSHLSHSLRTYAGTTKTRRVLMCTPSRGGTVAQSVSPTTQKLKPGDSSSIWWAKRKKLIPTNPTVRFGGHHIHTRNASRLSDVRRRAEQKNEPPEPVKRTTLDHERICTEFLRRCAHRTQRHPFFCRFMCVRWHQHQSLYSIISLITSCWNGTKVTAFRCAIPGYQNEKCEQNETNKRRAVMLRINAKPGLGIKWNDLLPDWSVRAGFCVPSVSPCSTHLLCARLTSTTI